MNDILDPSSERALALLRTRFSTPLPLLGEPGPSSAQLEMLLDAAVRVPDHGRLRPWTVHVVAGQYRAAFAEHIGRLYCEESPAPEEAKLSKLVRMPVTAPLLLVVTSRLAREHRIPEIEQLLSGGALCQNLLLAAHALGFGGYWLTGWSAASPGVKALFGVAPGDPILGFIAIGTRTPGGARATDERRATHGSERVKTWRGVDSAS